MEAERLLQARLGLAGLGRERHEKRRLDEKVVVDRSDDPQAFVARGEDRQRQWLAFQVFARKKARRETFATQRDEPFSPFSPIGPPSSRSLSC